MGRTGHNVTKGIGAAIVYSVVATPVGMVNELAHSTPAWRRVWAITIVLGVSLAWGLPGIAIASAALIVVWQAAKLVRYSDARLPAGIRRVQ